MNILEKLELEEGFRERMYDCPAGKKTIGIGVNLEATPIPKAVAQEWVRHILNDINVEMAKHDWYRTLNHDRRVVIQDMCYQMGVSGVLAFKNMISAIENRDWERAANEMLDSRWAEQTPNRANRNANGMRTGGL